MASVTCPKCLETSPVDLSKSIVGLRCSACGHELIKDKEAISARRRRWAIAAVLVVVTLVIVAGVAFSG